MADPQACEPPTRRQRVLAIFCNPLGTDHLRLQSEQRVLKQCLRDRAQLEIVPAATVDDVRQALLGAALGVWSRDFFPR